MSQSVIQSVSQSVNEESVHQHSLFLAMTYMWYWPNFDIHLNVAFYNKARLPEYYACEWKELAWLIHFAQGISMISMNVKQVYNEWYDTVSDNEIDSACILREMIEVREGWDIFNIGVVDFIINDLCVN